MNAQLAIRSVGQHDIVNFFAYLDDHLADNGKDGNALFQPMSRNESRFPEHKKFAFASGLATPFGEAGWRRAWIAEDETGRIAGHIDLRARPEPHTAHRTMLGMGVHRKYRRQGLGQRLIDTAVAWARSHPVLDWVDLEVLSANEPACRLYARMGFATIGEIRDMFRIDGKSFAYTLMALPLRVS